MLSIAEAEELTKSIRDRVIPPAKARAVTNRFILENLRDGLCAGTPCYALVQSEPVWLVPVLLSRPEKAPAEVGEVVVQAIESIIIGFTPPLEVLKNARAVLA